MCEISEFTPHRAFSKIQKEGVITRKRISIFLGNHSKAVSKDEAQNIISYFDKDGDGQLDIDEVMQIFLTRSNLVLREKVL